MRIIAGRLGGRRLKSAREPGLRPAMAKTREALFSMLEARGLEWNNLKALDIFAGCGSLGFECLSRGAARSVFVENGQRQYQLLKDNARELQVHEKCGIWKQDARRFLRRAAPEAFNLVFLDPPYGRNLAGPALAWLVKNRWLAKGAFIVAELEKQAALPEIRGLDKLECRRFGQTVLHIWKYDEDSVLPGNI